MSHIAVDIVGIQDPSQWLGEIISGVEDAGDVAHNNVTIILPVLNGKENWMSI